MTTIDFFVHPEFALHTGFSRTESYEKYMEDIKRLIKESSCPVLINDSDKTELEIEFPKGNVLDSASHYIDEYPINRGEVRPEYWKRFTRIVNGGDNHRIHGSFLGECTTGFAIQLFAYLKRNEHWHDWHCEIDEERFKEEKALAKKHEEKGDFLTSTIKIGTVLALAKIESIRKPGIIPRILFKDKGNITYQLIDKQTKVYVLDN